MAEESGFEAAKRRIDEIAEVTQFVIPSSGSDQTTFVLGTRAWGLKIEVKKYHRASEAVWSPLYIPNIVQT